MTNERQNGDGPYDGYRLPGRRRPVHQVREYANCPTIVFVTVCTKNKVQWLADETVHKLLRAVWTEAAAWHVGKYVLMPDHLHLFASPAQHRISLTNWVEYWKAAFIRRHGDPLHGWQSDYWDTQLRRNENYLEKWHYMLQNPVRKGLVENPNDWPFQGEIHVLAW